MGQATVGQMTGHPSKVGNLPSNLGTLCLWVLELIAMYATDRQRDRHTDGQKQRCCPLPYGRGIKRKKTFAIIDVKLANMLRLLL